MTMLETDKVGAGTFGHPVVRERGEPRKMALGRGHRVRHE